MKIILKSVRSVLAGFMAVFILSVVTDLILEKLKIFPSIQSGLFVAWMLVVALIYRTVYTVLGGYITAALAPANPMRHVWVLAIIGFVAAVGGSVANWDKSYHWYPIALVALSLPSVWSGGKIFSNRLDRANKNI